MDSRAGAIARELAAQAERVCRHYLPNGRRAGNYWQIGDVHDTPGRSLYVRLKASADGSRAAGKWTDAQSGEHGDLLDIVRASSAGGTLGEALAEARRFLGTASQDDAGEGRTGARQAGGSPEGARRLFAAARPIAATLVETYLASRGIPRLPDLGALRFHPRCWYRRVPGDCPRAPAAMPAMIAAVTDPSGTIMGAHRTWLVADGSAKAPIACPRKAMGRLLGNGVRFGPAAAAMVVGEGIETMLSIRAALPAIPAIAALSAAHLAELAFPPGLRRLYVAREPDAGGHQAFGRLRERAASAGIEVRPLDSRGADFNADLRSMGKAALREMLRAGLTREDRSR